jgi:hypothetical protein
MKLFLMLALVACGGTQKSATAYSNPTCLDVIEHGYGLATQDLHGHRAIETRRQFGRIKPQLVSTCEQMNPPLEKRQCIMRARSPREADACE